MQVWKAMALALALGSSGSAGAIIGAPMGTAQAQDSALERIADAAFTAAERQIIYEFYRQVGLPEPIYWPEAPDAQVGNQGNGRGNGGGNGRGNSGGGLPPGLQRQLDRTGSLPPGLERQLQQNGTLPPGLQAQALPSQLYTQLPQRTGDFEIKRVGQQVVLLNAATNAILDIINLAVGQ